MSESLYDRLGGEAAVNSAVDVFTGKCLTITGSIVFSTIPTWTGKSPNNVLS